jgi:hypothetical protein
MAEGGGGMRLALLPLVIFLILSFNNEIVNGGRVALYIGEVESGTVNRDDVARSVEHQLHNLDLEFAAYDGDESKLLEPEAFVAVLHQPGETGVRPVEHSARMMHMLSHAAGSGVLFLMTDRPDTTQQASRGFVSGGAWA